VAGWNCAAALSTGKVIIGVADDFLPPRNWDQLLLNLPPKGWEDGEYVVKTEDGVVHSIFVLAILTRKRYERFGYLFYPGYLSMFCDTEFGDVALRDNVVIDGNHLLFEHLHPSCRKRAQDAADLVHASTDRWKAGEMLYHFRKGRGFPLDAGPRAQLSSQEETSLEVSSEINNRYVAYMQVIRNDLCLLEVCQKLLKEGVRDFCFCQPDEYWSGESIKDEFFQEVKEIAAQLSVTGAQVNHRIFKVSDYRMTHESRIATETRVRNESLKWVRSFGYKHILVVDSDEYWVSGTLDIIKSYVEQGHQVISSRMMPVIGLPGYPVDGAQDLAVVYLGDSLTFKACRSPYARQTIIPKPLVYHFTGTRRSIEEVAEKHRRSGHYDDANYFMEEWIREVLPNIKPGFVHQWPTGHVGLHMYGPHQIWPTLRKWRQDELEDMPVSLHKYLGG
jgi:hypothetical protein